MTKFEESITKAPLGKTWLFYAGQAGYILKSKAGEILAVDVYFSECGERIENTIAFKRLLPHILDSKNNIYDFVIATHNHFDHYDVDAMPDLLGNGSTHFLLSEECEKEVNKVGNLSQSSITYGKPGDKVQLGSFTVELTECDHGTLAPDAFGVVITVDGKKIYMAGDTCKRMDRVDYINEFGPFDIVIGPINGAYGNMNEQDFAEYASNLNTNLIIPCHYGMFARHGGNPGLFLQIMAEKYDYSKVCLMAMGEAKELD